MLHLASLFSVLEFFAHGSLKFLIVFDKLELTHLHPQKNAAYLFNQNSKSMRKSNVFFLRKSNIFPGTLQHLGMLRLILSF